METPAHPSSLIPEFMCGIVGAVSSRNVVDLLIEGIRKLEYRGYDSTGIAFLKGGHLERLRSTGRVAKLDALVRKQRVHASTGLSHTRWATHGAPTEANAHPHFSTRDGLEVGIVHNGIVENHDPIRSRMKTLGYRFASETDTEVMVHHAHSLVAKGLSLFEAVKRASREWEKFGRTFRPVEFEALHQANLPPEAQQHFEQCAPILERLGFVPAVTCRLKPEPRPVLAHCLLSQDGATEASVAWIWGSPGLSFNSVLEDGRVLETACVEESLPQSEIELINASAGYSTQMFAVGEGGIFADEDLLRSAYQSHLQRLAELEQRRGCGTLHLTADQIPDLKRYANAVFGQWQFDHGKVDNRPQPQPCPRGIARRIADLFEEQTRGQAGAENGAGLLVEHYA